MLDKQIFRYITERLKYEPSIDLFATRINTQLRKFFSFRPDPECIGVDAFTVDWRNIEFYAFPPFCCLPRVIQKISQDEARGILVVPDWPNQPWYTQFLNMAITYVTLSPRPRMLMLPQQDVKHPLHKTLHLRAAVVCGKQSKN